MSDDFLLEQKRWKYQNTSCNREKNVTGVNFDIFTVFLGEHVKSQRPSNVLAGSEEISYFQSWLVLFRIHQSQFDGAE